MAVTTQQHALFEVAPEPTAGPKRGAFGYLPLGWPSPRMFGAPVTPAQVKITSQTARSRGVPLEELPYMRSLVLNAYGMNTANSKGNAALFIDWLMHASQDSIEEALAAATTYSEPVQFALRIA